MHLQGGVEGVLVGRGRGREGRERRKGRKGRKGVGLDEG